MFLFFPKIYGECHHDSKILEGKPINKRMKECIIRIMYMQTTLKINLG